MIATIKADLRASFHATRPFGDPMAIATQSIESHFSVFYLFLMKFGHFTHEDITALMHSRVHTQVNKNSIVEVRLSSYFM